MKSNTAKMFSILFPLLLIAFGALLVAANFTPGTWLSGWDTLHPEFNFPLAFQRSLWGVWRTDQGLGAVAAHSHMADLPKIILLWLTSFIFPANLLRYVLVFVCLIAGPLGIYALIRVIIPDKKHGETAGFLGGLVYLMNLGTVQHFIVPFEMFTVAYAIIPWLFLSTIHCINTPLRKYILWHVILLIVASPMAYAATLWYVTMGCLWIFTLIYGGKKHIKTAIALMLLSVILNAYWIMPNLYYAAGHATEVIESKINRLFTPEAIAKNRYFGTWDNAFVFKNFLFDWQIFNNTHNRFEDVLSPWTSWFKQPVVSAFGYVVSVVSVAAAIVGLRRKNRVLYALFPVTVIAFLALCNGSWPMSDIFIRLNEWSPVISETLRFPFTKFSIIAMAGTAVFFGYGISLLIESLRNKKIITLLITAIVTVWASLSFWPAFTGNLVHPNMRIRIPDDYTELFKWFNGKEKEGRVAILPVHSFWGWTYYRWGYQGAGFLQFGISQPILDRDYDRWSPVNEQYQREMAYAVYSQRPALVADVLAKYNVRWILFDASVFAPGDNKNVTLSWFIPTLLAKTPGVSEVAQFGNDIKVYEVVGYPNHVTLYGTLPQVKESMFGGMEDHTYRMYGTYIVYHSPASATMPFRSYVNKLERYNGPMDNEPMQTFSAQTQLHPFVNTCGNRSDVTGGRETREGMIMYTSHGGPVCDAFGLPALKHNQAYVVSVTSRNRQGFPLQLCVSNHLTSHCDLFVHMSSSREFITERYLFPPLADYGKGYTLNFNNFATRGMQSINDIREITVDTTEYPMIPDPDPLQAGKRVRTSENGKVDRIAPVIFRINMPKSGTAKTIVLDESFENGWYALVKTHSFPYWKSAGVHVLVNNWANGWIINPADSTSVYIVFLPQVLQFIGFLILPIPFLFLLKRSK